MSSARPIFKFVMVLGKLKTSLHISKQKRTNIGPEYKIKGNYILLWTWFVNVKTFFLTDGSPCINLTSYYLFFLVNVFGTLFVTLIKWRKLHNLKHSKFMLI